MRRAKCLWFFWVPIYTFNPNKLNLTCFCTWLTGDDGSSDEPQQGVLVKESESLYTLWCTGRVGCDGMLVEIKVHAVANILVLKLVSWRGGGGSKAWNFVMEVLGFFLEDWGLHGYMGYMATCMVQL